MLIGLLAVSLPHERELGLNSEVARIDGDMELRLYHPRSVLYHAALVGRFFPEFWCYQLSTHRRPCSTGSTETNTKTETGISKPHRDLHRATERQGDSRPLGSQPTAPTPLSPGPVGRTTPARPLHRGIPHAPRAWLRSHPHIT